MGCPLTLRKAHCAASQRRPSASTSRLAGWLLPKAYLPMAMGDVLSASSVTEARPSWSGSTPGPCPSLFVGPNGKLLPSHWPELILVLPASSVLASSFMNSPRTIAQARLHLRVRTGWLAHCRLPEPSKTVFLFMIDHVASVGAHIPIVRRGKRDVQR
ncbi:hypothetical protein V2G26_014073 [Clonostachys chloroleuca]